mgnify:CR=1 FL=1
MMMVIEMLLRAAAIELTVIFQDWAVVLVVYLTVRVHYAIVNGIKLLSTAVFAARSSKKFQVRGVW